MKSGFPVKTDAFLLGQELLYSQFNEISFFVEDENQENLYYQILSKLFKNIKITKIFPLNGKANVINDAKKNKGDRKKIYLVDKDFDDILNKTENLENLFYLERYSIENYLLEFDAIREVIIEERPKLNKVNIRKIFKFDKFVNESINLFQDLVASYLTIQKHGLGIPNVKNNPEKFCVFNPTSSLRISEFDGYKARVDTALKQKDGRLSISGQIKRFRPISMCLFNIPGKYILKFLNLRLKHLFNIQIELESFVFRLAKNCDLSSLLHLKDSVLQYTLNP